MKKTAILITTYNRRLITLKCIESLKKNSKFDSSFDIYIADSNSKDKTLQEIKRLNPEIKVFNVGDNFFWSQGMNLAWKKARETYEYDFYLWLNDDTNLNIKSLEIIFEDYRVAPNKSILVGVTSDVNGNITYGGRNSTEGEIISPNGTIQRVNYINGNFVLIPKNVFNQLGYIDKRYSHALGDIDYGLRAKNKDVNIFISSKIIGNCSRNKIRSYESIIKTLDNEKNLFKRMVKLNRSLVLPFKEYYYFNKKHFGLVKTIKFIFGYLLLILSPTLYFKLKTQI